MGIGLLRRHHNPQKEAKVFTLADLDLSELKQLAKDKGIDTHKMRKAEIIEAIQNESTRDS